LASLGIPQFYGQVSGDYWVWFRWVSGAGLVRGKVSGQSGKKGSHVMRLSPPEISLMSGEDGFWACFRAILAGQGLE